jgi:hypothetical protein
MKAMRSLLWLLVATGAASMARAEMITEIGAGAFQDNNVSNAQLDRDIKRDSAVWASLSAGRLFDIGEDNSLTVTADLTAHAFNRYAGLSHASFGVSVADRMKLGLGAGAPWIMVSGHAARLQFREDVRDGWLYQAGLAGGKRIGERWEMQAAYRFERRTGEDTESEVPGLSGDVFDATAHNVLLDARYSYDDTLVVGLGYGWRRGDVVSTTQRNFTIFRASSAIADDPAFGDGAYAYRLDATTHSVSVGLSKAIDRHSSLNVGFERRLTYAAGGNDYYDSVPNVTYLYSY